MTEKMPNLVPDVMGQIKERGVQMRSRRYFVFISILLGLGVGSAIVTAFISAVIAFVYLFILLPSGMVGSAGFRVLFLYFPWLPLILAIAGIYFGTRLLRRVGTTYRRTTLSIGIMLVAIVGVFATATGYVTVRERWHESSHFTMLFPRLARIGSGWVLGVVESANVQDGFIVKSVEGESITVVNRSDTKIIHGEVAIGKPVRVIGRRQGDVLTARFIIVDPLYSKKRNR